MYSRNDIQLRGLRGSDVAVLLSWENNIDNWHISERSEPVSQKDLELLIENQERVKNLYELDQYRFMIVATKTGRQLGTIDFYAADWTNDSAYIGILIAKKEDRRNGAGYLALELLLEKMSADLELRIARARIEPSNTASIRLFEKAGFKSSTDKINSDQNGIEYLEFVCELDKR